MSLVAILTSLISGAIGGNIAGMLLKKYDLGTTGDSVAGAIGGAMGGPLTIFMLTRPEALSGVISNIMVSGIGGAIVMIVIGLIKNSMSNRHAH